MPGRAAATLGWTLTAATTYAAVFVLPYRFPLREPVLSDTWTAGGNNQVAAIGLALVSVAVALALWLRSPRVTLPETTGQLSPRYLPAAVLIAVAWTATLGSAVARAHIYWGDEGYFLHQLQTGLIFHRTLYTQFDFAYGPLLYYWPAVCIRALALLGLRFVPAYLVSLASLQAAGLALLFYVVRSLPLRRSLQTCAFVLFAFGTLNSTLGLNYTLFRFILPFAALVLLSRQRSIANAALVAGLGEIACLATSPEQGLAFAAAAVVYASRQALATDRRWLFAAAATLAGAALFAEIAEHDYLLTFGNMAKGAFNLLLTPTPQIVALLVAAVAFAPVAVARSMRASSPNGLILAFYVASLGMIPAALGRCDSIHVFFNGIGLYLLSLIVLNAASLRWRRISILAVALFLVFTLARNFGIDRFRFGLLTGTNAVHEDWGFDEAALRRALGSAQISAPILAPQRVIDDLARTGQYVPSYFCGWINVSDRETEARMIAEMRQTPFALVALADPVASTPQRDRQIALAMRMGFAAHAPNPDYIRGELLAAELQSHWIARGRFGDYMLYERRN